MIQFDKSKSLEFLENDFWKDIKNPPTEMISKIYQSRKKPINLLTYDELRLLISQNIGLPYLIPIAMDIFQMNLLLEATYYPGDLLLSVIKIEKRYWINNPDQKIALLEMINNNEKIIASSRDLLAEIKEEIFYEKAVLSKL